MRTERIAFGMALAIGGIVAQGAASAEEYRGTLEQRMACTPDVWRLCGAAIPDVDRIVACLRQNTPSLSDGCRAVFESNNSMDQPQPVPPRGRVAPAPGTRGKQQPPTQIAPPPRSSDVEE